MDEIKTAVVGIGATGAVLAAALLKRNPETILVDPRPGLKGEIEGKGIRITGQMDLAVPVCRFCERISELKSLQPDLIFVATKTFHLPAVLDELKDVYREGTKIVSTHNGLGTEDLIAERFGTEAAFRMSLNLGVSLKGQTEVEMAFFNPPNHLGALAAENRPLGIDIAGLLTDGGLTTEFVDDIKFHVWKKMVMKCTMASICAVTDRTIRDAIAFPPTRRIAEECFQEILAVARAQGYDLGEDYTGNALEYLEKVGVHKDSMCVDIANRTRTEIDFLGGKVVQYGEELGVPTPCYRVMTNLVKAMEDSYLGGR